MIGRVTIGTMKYVKRSLCSIWLSVSKRRKLTNWSKWESKRPYANWRSWTEIHIIWPGWWFLAKFCWFLSLENGKKNSRRIKVYLFYKSVKVTTVICPKKTPPSRRFCPKRGLNPSFFPFSRVISSRPNIIETVHKIIK